MEMKSCSIFFQGKEFWIKTFKNSLSIANDKILLQVHSRFKPFYTNDWHDEDHHFRVFHMAKNIYSDYSRRDEKNKCSNNDSMELNLKIACLTHDIGRYWEINNHPEIGAEKVSAYLSLIDYPEESISEISEAIKSHDTDDVFMERSIISKILYDADNLDCLTVSGIARCNLEYYRRQAEKKEINFQEILISTINRWEELICLLNFEISKRMALYFKQTWLDNFVKNLIKENSIDEKRISYRLQPV
jgi:HD superfamily phosphodiesterase